MKHKDAAFTFFAELPSDFIRIRHLAIEYVWSRHAYAQGLDSSVFTVWITHKSVGKHKKC
ncbi:hypothetical protein [uncultured Treponema sp.]|uniref:hypothetical protein n=1 Tax=uncultured Treponema sp. TaxID=162155 RepID=UPI00280AFEEC|nr:hypothetical protein [uncultured Treponema sp.]